MYQPHCGLENVLMSWGHDGEAGWGRGRRGPSGAAPLGARGDPPSPTEYMYRMMKFNKFALPPEVGGGWGPS